MISDVTREDLFTISTRVDRKLCPLKCIRKEKPSTGCQTPSGAVADSLWGNICVRSKEHLNGLNIWVGEIKRLFQSDESDIIVKLGSVPVLVKLHLLDASLLMTSFQNPVMSTGNNLITESVFVRTLLTITLSRIGKAPCTQ